MLFADSYRTLDSNSQALFKDKGSKFYAYAFPVKSEAEIKTQLQQLKEEHPSARHHCYAWRLGADQQAYRANDDGEPSGTAGKPILGQIQSRDLTNVLVVVVRYFGGILLGVPGLINAYKNAAAEALDAGKIVERHIEYEYRLDFDTEDMSAVMRLLKESSALILNNSYEERNFVLFRLKKQNSVQFEDRIKELYKTKLHFNKLVE